ncbi:YhjD/YihY/BrkB family envelope integrity protein [Nakamurella lactea]|uniref:YhjD/YihY/BrkB family envelope integrity protein n=1 Tax=Nakamurella lactea TaxID=459515 RepID=UPI00040DC72F|nr:YhjD/YihY/BrkB family envelope integrity protein [Nakamurella lactea]
MTGESELDPDAVPTSSGPMTSFVARLTATAARAAGVADRYWPGRLWARLLELEFIDRSVALAAKAFVSLFPFIIVIAAITPAKVRDDVLDVLALRFGISGDLMDTVRTAFASPTEIRSASGIFGVLLTLAFAVSFTTALQRVFLRAWRRPPGGGLKNKGRGALWIAGLTVFLLMMSTVGALLVGFSGAVLPWLLGLAGGMLLWWWSGRLMTRGEVRWRALLPTAVLTGIGGWAYTLTAAIWMPRTLTSQFSQFGPFGIALAFVTWFTGFSFIVVVAGALGPVLAEGDSWLARRLRGPADSVLEAGALPPLPPPPLLKTLAGAFAKGQVAVVPVGHPDAGPDSAEVVSETDHDHRGKTTP